MLSLSRLCDLLVVNHEELANHLGRPVEETNVTPAEVESLHQAGIKNVMITCNQHGLFFSGQGLALRKEAFRYGEVKNPTGTGDAFTSAFVAGILEGLSLEECFLWARVFAGLKVTKAGGSNLPTYEEFINGLSSFD